MKKKFLFLVIVSLLTVFCSNSFARYNYGYSYHGGRWHNHGFMGFDFVVNYPPVGAVIASLPFGYASIYYGGIPYYYYGSTYFTPCPGGYIVVPAPQAQQETTAPDTEAPQQSTVTAAAEEAAKSGSFIVISIPKKEGGFIPVRLIKHGNGYIGPQGEFYAGHPTVDQLSALYGE